MAMAGTFYVMNLILTGVKLEEVAIMGAVIGAMAAAYAVAFGVIIASGVVGAIVTFSVGIALAMILTGLATLATVITAMVTHAVTIINLIKSANIDESFFTKAKAVGIVFEFFEKIAGFTSKFLSAGLTTGVIDKIKSIWGPSPEEKLRSKLLTISGFIKTVMDSMINIVTEIQYGNINTEKLSILGPILHSITNLFQTIMSPIEKFKNIKDLEFGLNVAQNFIRGIIGSFSGLITEIKRFINEVVINLTIIKMEEIEKVTKIFELLSMLFTALTPSPELI